jgi:sec-independent protein translocase protein TatC
MTPQFMRSSRRYATVIIIDYRCNVVTPTPDLVTMLTVSLPLFLLYEVSIFMYRQELQRNKKKAEIEFYKN